MLRTSSLCSLLLSLLALTGCKRPEKAPKTQSAVKVPKTPAPVKAPASQPAMTGPQAALKTYGALREIMHQNQMQGRIQLDQLPLQKGLFGVGALENLAGEVTIYDGQAWVSKPGHNELETISSKKSSEKATLLVTAQVRNWSEIVVEEDILWKDRDARFKTMAQKQGIEVSQPFAFTIEGTVEALHWHVIDGSKIPQGVHGHEAHMQAAKTGEIDSKEISVVGFYSEVHQGVFTHMDSYSHLHVIDRKQKLTGHVDQGTIKAGSKIRFALAN